ncbi:phage portal protein [Leeia sp. TBRC 13508]|uniref:Phage portal protein n=1 Tax=Leeia speluncae TaxID=2884804 RepID=A0ABS8D9J2_9NEIS|nr:phage portal protein [Leeia speluncae]MCB6184278.1 phage portal protein [Leeia speluncae]
MFFRGMFSQPAASSGGWLSSVFGGASDAGVLVNADTAMGLTAVQACVTLLAESIGQLPVALYRRNDKDGRELVLDHPVARLLARPNAFQTSFEHIEQKQLSLGLRGNAYVFKQMGQDGYPESLTVLDPDRVQVLKGTDLMPYYRLIETGEVLPMRLIHHVRWSSANSYIGMSPIDLHKNALGLALAVDKHASKMFQNGTTLSGVIERPSDVAPIASRAVIDGILDDWAKRQGGLDNVGKTALLQEGMTFKALAMTNEDAQLILSRKMSVTEIARIFKVPPHMIGDLEKATFSNIEHQAIQFVIYCLLPWVKRHEQAMMRDFLLDSDADLYIECNVAGLLRGDLKTRYEAYAVGRQWGWLSVNDIRRLENMSPVKGGETYLQPLNMVDATKLPTGNTGPTKASVDEVEKILSNQYEVDK